jgi:hypothetical protein
MSFAGDLKDFTKSFMAGYKLSTERGKANDRAKYYDAMIGLKGAQAKAQAGARAASLGVRKEALELKKRDTAAREALIPGRKALMEARTKAAGQPRAGRAVDSGGFEVPQELKDAHPGAHSRRSHLARPPRS